MRLWQLLLAAALFALLNVAFAGVQRFALIVGNNQGHAPDMELRYAEADAAKVAQVLRDLGGFQPADTVILRGEDAQTVRSSLISLNDRIRAAQAIPGQQALLFVYYSGHADAQAALRRTAIDAVIGIGRVVHELASLFQPGVDRVPGHSDETRRLGFRLAR